MSEVFGEMGVAVGAVLLVEDNEDDVFLLKRALKAAGISNKLFLAEDGRCSHPQMSRKISAKRNGWGQIYIWSNRRTRNSSRNWRNLRD